MKRFNKKGSISISINMIVVVVLAFVMLGLMLGLGQKIIQNATETSEQVSEQTKQDIINKLTQSDKPLYFNQREFDVPFGKKKTIAFGVKNIDPSPSDLTIKISYINGEDVVPIDSSKSASEDQGGAFYWAEVAQRYGPGESKVFDVQYRAPGGSRDTYMFKFELIKTDGEGSSETTDPDDVVAEQIVFINVI